MVSCSFLGGYQYFGGTFCLFLQDPEPQVEGAYVWETLVFTSKGLQCHDLEHRKVNTDRHDSLKTYEYLFIELLFMLIS
jgi:hypothetical protein